MNRLYQYLKLLRISHWIKNLLVFLPLFFSGKLLERKNLLKDTIAFLIFCLLSSAVYIVNDIRDVNRDRRHPEKRKRPIASGAVSIREAYILFLIFFMAAALLIATAEKSRAAFPAIYLMLNLFYSMGLKNVPFLDVIILVSGFVIRVMYGAAVTGIEVSGWLYLTIFAISFYLSLGKRRNELESIQDGFGLDTRKVLKYYNYRFLDKGMQMCFGLANTFYALWAMDNVNPFMLWTVPGVIIVSLRYSYDIENQESYGDPVEVILSDKVIILLTGFIVAFIAALIYTNRTQA